MVNLLTKTCDFQRVFTFNKSCPVMCLLEYPPAPAGSLRLECIFHPAQVHSFHFSHAEILFDIWHITDFPLIWDIIQVASIFLFLLLNGILKSLISSYENRWAGLSCYPFASINLRYALKLFLVQATFHLSPFKQCWYKISEKGAEKETGSTCLADVLLPFMP